MSPSIVKTTSYVDENNNIANTLFLDIGNSFVKIKIKETFFAWKINDYTVEKFSRLTSDWDIRKIIVSSVNEEFYRKLTPVLSTNSIEVVHTSALMKNQRIIDFSNVSNIGTDRQLGLLGATSIFKPPIITVDCGSCITTNLLNKDFICLGGTIMLGIGIYLQTFSTKFPALPAVKLDDFNEEIGFENSTNALVRGITSTIRGGILDCIISEIKFFRNNKLLDNSGIEIVFTGGWSELVFNITKEHIYNNDIIRPYIKNISHQQGLVLSGIQKLFEESFVLEPEVSHNGII